MANTLLLWRHGSISSGGGFRHFEWSPRLVCSFSQHVHCSKPNLSFEVRRLRVVRRAGDVCCSMAGLEVARNNVNLGASTQMEIYPGSHVNRLHKLNLGWKSPQVSHFCLVSSCFDPTKSYYLRPVSLISSQFLETALPVIGIRIVVNCLTRIILFYGTPTSPHPSV
jgi:hypothetical protein